MRFVRRLVLPLLFVASLPTASSQGVSSYGVKVGVTAAELHNRGSSNPRWGLTGGLFAITPLGSGFGLLGEAGYHAKGNRFQDISGADRGEIDSRFNYLFLLAAPRYTNTLGGGPLQLFVYGGPRVDLFLGETLRALDASESLEASEVFSNRDLRTFVFGVAAGIGLDFSRLLPVPLTAEFRYNGDVTHAYSFLRGEERVRNRTFDLRLGLSF